jgi:pimeloyl-ACP methyl ester carboxylesterase
LDVRVAGVGQPVVLVHGAGTTKESWEFVEPLLASEFAVWSYDRRGRGGSGDHSPYSLEAEVADLTAVATRAGPAPHLVGHSFGACCAIEAARNLPDLSTLVLYEAPLFQQRLAAPVDEALRLLADGAYEEALPVFLRQVVGFSSDELALVRSVPEIWASVILTAPTLQREIDALSTLGWAPARYQAIEAPTLYLSGALTDSPAYASADDIRTAITHAEAGSLPGQRHIAMVTDPDGFVSAIIDLLRQHTAKP